MLTLATTTPFILIGPDADPVVVQVLLTLFGIAIALAAVPPGIAAYKTADAGQLPDATTQVNILMRVGGALGGAVFAVVLAAGLPYGTEQAFRTTFWWLAGTSLLAIVSTAWLWRTLHVAEQSPGRGGGSPATRIASTGSLTRQPPKSVRARRPPPMLARCVSSPR